MRHGVGLVVATIAISCTVSLAAQDAGEHETGPASIASDQEAEQTGGDHGADAHEPSGGEHADTESHAFKNSLGLFLGVTVEQGHDAQGTWGVEYTRHVAHGWAVGAVGEYAGGDLRNTLLVVFGVWAPWRNLELVAGPGVEFHEGRDFQDEHRKSGGDGHPDEDATYFVFRVGAAWHLHLTHRVGFLPAVYLDVVDGEEVWVYGLNVTYWF